MVRRGVLHRVVWLAMYQAMVNASGERPWRVSFLNHSVLLDSPAPADWAPAAQARLDAFHEIVDAIAPASPPWMKTSASGPSPVTAYDTERPSNERAITTPFRPAPL